MSLPTTKLAVKIDRVKFISVHIPNFASHGHRTRPQRRVQCRVVWPTRHLKRGSDTAVSATVACKAEWRGRGLQKEVLGMKIKKPTSLRTFLG